MKLNKLILGLFAGALLFTSCSEDEFIPTQNVITGKYQGGILVLNEGAFGKGNSTVSYISNDFSNVENEIFSGVNIDMKLGDTGQSMVLDGENAYIVMNGSNKIEIVNRYTFESIATISTGLSNPRYMTIVDGKGYVTNWGDTSDETDDYIAEVNLANNTIDASNNISVVLGPERILSVNKKLYIAQQGAYGQNNKLSIIDLKDKSTNTLVVGDIPKGMQVIGNNLYVLCSGIGSWPEPANESAGSIVTIDLTSDMITTTLSFSDNKQHPNHLITDNTKLFYSLGNKVYALESGATELPTTELIDASNNGVKSLYGLNILKDRILIGDANDFASDSSIYFYGLNGSFIGDLKVGVSPNSFYLNN